MREDKFKLLLGNSIKRLREQRGYTQEAFCNLIKLEQPSLSNIETGKSLPNLFTFISIVKALEVKADDLLGINEKYDEVEIFNEEDFEIMNYILKLPSKTKSIICEILKNQADK